MNTTRLDDWMQVIGIFSASFCPTFGGRETLAGRLLLSGGRTSFRVVPWIRISILLVALGATAAAGYFCSREGLTWFCAFFLGFSVIGITGVLESSCTYIILTDTEIRFRETFGKTAIAKSDIVRVAWEAGCGVSLLRGDGTWTRLPDLGHNSQGLTNSIRSRLTST